MGFCENYGKNEKKGKGSSVRKKQECWSSTISTGIGREKRETMTERTATGAMRLGPETMLEGILQGMGAEAGRRLVGQGVRIGKYLMTSLRARFRKRASLLPPTNFTAVVVRQEDDAPR